MEFTVTVHASPEQVFDLLHVSVAQEARRLTGKEVSLYRIRRGFSYRFTQPDHQSGSFLVTAFEKPSLFGTRLNRGNRSSQFQYTLTPRNDQTEVRLVRQDFLPDGSPASYNALQTLAFRREFTRGLKQGLRRQKQAKH